MYNYLVYLCYLRGSEQLQVLINIKDGLKGKTYLERLNEILDALEELRDMLEKYYVSDTIEYLRHMLMEITTYCNILKYIKFLSIHGLRHIEELRVYDFLEEDLINGFQEIAKMKDVIEEGSLARHFHVVKTYYNEPYTKLDDSDDNLEMLSFILRMFYEKKIQTAGDIITNEKKQ